MDKYFQKAVPGGASSTTPAAPGAASIAGVKTPSKAVGGDSSADDSHDISIAGVKQPTPQKRKRQATARAADAAEAAAARSPRKPTAVVVASPGAAKPTAGVIDSPGAAKPNAAVVGSPRAAKPNAAVVGSPTSAGPTKAPRKSKKTDSATETSRPTAQAPATPEPTAGVEHPTDKPKPRRVRPSAAAHLQAQAPAPEQDAPADAPESNAGKPSRGRPRTKTDSAAKKPRRGRTPKADENGTVEAKQAVDEADPAAAPEPSVVHAPVRRRLIGNGVYDKTFKELGDTITVFCFRDFIQNSAWSKDVLEINRRAARRRTIETNRANGGIPVVKPPAPARWDRWLAVWQKKLEAMPA